VVVEKSGQGVQSPVAETPPALKVPFGQGVQPAVFNWADPGAQLAHTVGEPSTQSTQLLTATSLQVPARAAGTRQSRQSSSLETGMSSDLSDYSRLRSSNYRLCEKLPAHSAALPDTLTPPATDAVGPTDGQRRRRAPLGRHRRPSPSFSSNPLPEPRALQHGCPSVSLPWAALRAKRVALEGAGRDPIAKARPTPRSSFLGLAFFESGCGSELRGGSCGSRDSCAERQAQDCLLTVATTRQRASSREGRGAESRFRVGAAAAPWEFREHLGQGQQMRGARQCRNSHFALVSEAARGAVAGSGVSTVQGWPDQ
jgi:hypothetical protein